MTSAADRPDGRTSSEPPFDGKYELIRMVGEGGMGSVYEARNIATGRRVALKRMASVIARDATAVKRFIREARVATSVEHPNVVQIFDVGTEGGTPYIVMELLQGESFADLLERQETITKELLFSILAPVLDALDAAHALGIVHRDLKPENIFLARVRGSVGPVPKLLDFGISRIGASNELGLTTTGTILGTPYYMSPEQAMGRNDVDGRADIYAMGVLCYFALSGRFPFVADNYNALLIAVVTGTAEPLRAILPGIPPSLSDAIERAMARDPALRFQTIAEFTAALHQSILGNANAIVPPLDFAATGLPSMTPPSMSLDSIETNAPQRGSFMFGATTPIPPASGMRIRGSTPVPGWSESSVPVGNVTQGGTPQVDARPHVALGAIVVVLTLLVGIFGTLAFVASRSGDADEERAGSGAAAPAPNGTSAGAAQAPAANAVVPGEVGGTRTNAAAPAETPPAEPAERAGGDARTPAATPPRTTPPARTVTPARTETRERAETPPRTTPREAVTPPATTTTRSGGLDLREF